MVGNDTPKSWLKINEKHGVEVFSETMCSDNYMKMLAIWAAVHEKKNSVEKVCDVSAALHCKQMFYIALMDDIRFCKVYDMVVNWNPWGGRSGAGDVIKRIIHQIFTDEDVKKVQLMLSDPFPLDNQHDVMKRWMEGKNDVRDFIIGAMDQPAACIIGEVLSLCIAGAQHCAGMSHSDADEVSETQLRASYAKSVASINVYLVPIITISQFCDMFRGAMGTRKQRNETYRTIKEDCIPKYFEVLEQLETLKEGEYLKKAETIQEHYNQQKSFFEMFEDDCVGNVVVWECGDIKIDLLSDKCCITYS